MNIVWKGVAVLVSLLALAGGAFLFLQHHSSEPPAAAPARPLPEPLPKPPAQVTGKQQISHPVEPESSVISLPRLDRSDAAVEQALIALLGNRAVATALNLDGFIRRFVVTIDNLGRKHAASRLWPVQPTPGKFLSVVRAGDTYVADGNAERYTPFVRLVGSLQLARAAGLYRHFYPLLQQAYEELGYPRAYFNDRLVEVVDLMLETPDETGPLKLQLTRVHGPYESTRPWVRYEFADASLEDLAAGQKILLRIGTANARIIKARLLEFRNAIASR